MITKEEAIEALTAIRDEATEDEHSVCYVTSEDADAINMAIEALQARRMGTPSVEPRTYGVLCALADRECSFQGKEYAWCLTCPHISEEDRALVKKAVAEPKTGKWVKAKGMMPPEFHGHHCCSECGAFASMDAPHGNREYLSSFCPSCGSFNGGEEE